MRLKGHTALVTGSGRSLGQAIALRFAQEGANVITNSRSTPEECEAVAKQCRAFGVKSIGITADLSSREGVDALARKALQEFGRIDILVNNVGISPYVGLLDMSDEEWHKVLFVNLHQMFYFTRYFVPGMLEQRWGRILNITGHAYIHHHVGAHTSAGKAGAMGLTRAVASEFAGAGITCNEVCPGWMDTEIRRNKYYQDLKPANQRPWGSAEERVKEIPAGRLGTPEEFAALCAFLASDEGSYLTGQTYLVNGGTMFH